jgi:hypothetical protein
MISVTIVVLVKKPRERRSALHKYRLYDASRLQVPANGENFVLLPREKDGKSGGC